MLRALRAELPHEQFVYLADSGHAPYGERDDAHVIRRAHAITRHLLDAHHIKSLVVACNTATAAAIRQLRATYPALPIVGVEPALKPAATLSQTGVVGVMATRGTLNSEKFRALLATQHGKATFVLQPCDGLADAIERNDATKTEALCADYTRAMGQFGQKSGQMDVLVLGCTHYPFVTNTLRALVGTSTALLESGEPVARQTKRLLAEHHALVTPAAAHAQAPGAMQAPAPDPVLLTTGRPDDLHAAVQRWLQLDIRVAPLDV